MRAMRANSYLRYGDDPHIPHVTIPLPTRKCFVRGEPVLFPGLLSGGRCRGLAEAQPLAPPRCFSIRRHSEVRLERGGSNLLL